MLKLVTPEELELWQMILMSAVRAGKTADFAALEADHAIMHLRNRLEAD